MTVVIGVLALLVGLVLGWALRGPSGRRRGRGAGEERALLLEAEVGRLTARTAELDALVDVAGQESVRLHGEVAASSARAEALARELAALLQERGELDAALAEERRARAEDRATHDAAAHRETERAAIQAAELELAERRARDAEAEAVALRARLEARDALITDLQEQVAALGARVDGPAPEPDDLAMIEGVGRVLEGMLHDAGITSYRQLAELSEAEGAEARLDEFLDRIKEEGWSDQARHLHRLKYGEEKDRTAH